MKLDADEKCAGRRRPHVSNVDLCAGRLAVEIQRDRLQRLDRK